MSSYSIEYFALVDRVLVSIGLKIGTDCMHIKPLSHRALLQLAINNELRSDSLCLIRSKRSRRSKAFRHTNNEAETAVRWAECLHVDESH